MLKAFLIFKSLWYSMHKNVDQWYSIFYVYNKIKHEPN